MTTAIRLYRTYILSTFVPLNTIRRLFRVFEDKNQPAVPWLTFSGKWESNLQQPP